tara:strand:+ start:320 stop:961 length:642 start_codon:yes stop_codon:yes gene_type:complete
MTSDTTRIIEGAVVSILFKDDKNGKEFCTVSLQQDGLTYPTNVRSRDVEILQRMGNANKHLQSGKSLWLGVEVRESPRAEGGVFRDILRITDASVDDVPQESPTPNGSPQSVQPAHYATSVAESWGSVDERIAWNSGINNATEATEPPEHEGDESRWLYDINRRANLIYLLIRRGPFQDAAERPQEAPDGTSNTPPDPLDEDYYDVDGREFEA